ncbi:MAG: hypothetical protein KDB62_00930 [Solirubrobacterales bacterium]|nr:hypothetical protein [Solirubrobacterales bacterium]
MPGRDRTLLRREALGFAIGSFFFALGAVPGYLSLVGGVADNVTFFIGSLFFTTAGLIQLALTGRWWPGRWKSAADRDDWWAAATQSVGTFAFNISTGTTLFAHLSAEQARDHVWRPDMIGSILFLVASYLAIRAMRGVNRLWEPGSRDWWISWLNMTGSVFFGISAIASYVDPSSGQPLNVEWINIGTFLGALCFLAGGVLLWRSEAAAEDPGPAGDRTGRPG